jgi:signal transduction histidine kinase
LDNEIYKDPQQKLMLYRIIQELTKNAVNHGKANYISVHCDKQKNSMVIHFEDNGSGFKNAEESDGTGIANIKNRVVFLKGKISFKSSDQGSICNIILPLND